jgi:hypothetical protein
VPGLRPLALLAAAAAALCAAAAAHAHPPGPALSVAIEGLRQVPVSYNTESGYTELEADAIGRRLGDSDAVAVALVAPSAILPAGAEATARDVAAHLADDRVYVVASHGRLGAWAGDDDAAEVRALVREVRGEPPGLAVADLAGRLADRERQAAADAPPGWLWPLVATISLVLLLGAAIGVRSRLGAAAASSRP